MENLNKIHPADLRVIDVAVKYSIRIDLVVSKLRFLHPGQRFRATTTIPEETANLIISNRHLNDFWQLKTKRFSPLKRIKRCSTPMHIAMMYQIDIGVVLYKLRGMMPARNITMRTRLPQEIVDFVEEVKNDRKFWSKPSKRSNPPLKIIYTPQGGKV